MPPTPSILGEPGWILVKEAYASLKEKPGVDAKDTGHLRDGTVLEIEGRAFAQGKAGNQAILWYLVSAQDGKGWLSSEDCEVFATEAQAKQTLDNGSSK